VRRYPFVLAEKPPEVEGDDFTVFLDEAYEGFNSAEGERLFKEDGTETDMLKNAVNFLGEFQQHVARTKQFMEDLRKYDLLEPRNIRLERNGNVINLNGCTWSTRKSCASSTPKPRTASSPTAPWAGSTPTCCR